MQIIQRIKELSLTNFKGFSGCHKFNTDADIVLLVGPNGYGKTSFLEALGLLVNNHYEPKTRTYNTKRSELRNFLMPIQYRTPENGVEIKKIEAVEIKIEAEASVIENNSLKNTTYTWQLDKTHPQGGFLNVHPPKLLEPQENLEKLLSRLCMFFQEKIEFQFDQAATGRTLRDVLRPVPEEIIAIKGTLTDLKGDLEYEIGSLESRLSKANESELQDRYAKTAEPFFAAYNRFCAAYNKSVSENQKWKKISEKKESAEKSVEQGKDAVSFFKNVLEKRGIGIFPSDQEVISYFENYFDSIIRHWIESLRETAVEETHEGRKIRRNIEKIESEIRKIDAKYGDDLENESTMFDDKEGRCHALCVFNVLHLNIKDWISNIEKWAKKSTSDGHSLDRIKNELDRVDTDQLKQCKNILKNWLEPRIEAMTKKRKLEMAKKREEKRLEAYKTSHKVREAENIQAVIRKSLPDFVRDWKKLVEHEENMRHSEKNLKIAEKLKLYKDALDFVIGELEPKVSDDLKEDLQKIIQNISKRFQFVEGILPLEIAEGDQNSKSFTVLADDQRGLADFSTGQKSQIAICLLVSQNILLSRYLPHRIILLDDVTTSYDLTNLTREAILWRQLAYGSGSEKSELKRQIFISTHHEDLTNNLIALLAPPHGCTLRLIKFENWDQECGPSCSQYEVAPSEEIDQQLQRGLAEDIAQSYL